MTCTSHDTYFKTITRRALGCALSLLVGATLAISTPLVAAENAKSSASELSRDSHAALAKLLASDPAAKKLSAKAHAILVFPSVTKAGFMIGGQYGEGALIKNGRTIAYYNTAGASYGFQAGVQVYGYAMFFMNEKSLADLNKTEELCSRI